MVPKKTGADVTGPPVTEQALGSTWPSGLFQGAKFDVLVFDVHDLAAVELQADVPFRPALVIGQLR